MLYLLSNYGTSAVQMNTEKSQSMLCESFFFGKISFHFNKKATYLKLHEHCTKNEVFH